MYKEFYEGRAKRETLDYVPIFALGEVAIGLWMVFWNNERFVASQICVMINSLSQLYAITQLPARRQGNQLTHLVANMFAGIGVLDLLDNGYVPNKIPLRTSTSLDSLITLQCRCCASVCMLHPLPNTDQSE